MSYPRQNSLLPRARQMRREMTPQERRLWYDFLRGCPYRFTRQKVIGPYILDFYCHKARLAVEVDGAQHYEKDGQEADRRRTHYLSAVGITVLRLSNADINTRFSAACEEILRVVAQKIQR